MWRSLLKGLAWASKGGRRGRGRWRGTGGLYLLLAGALVSLLLLALTPDPNQSEPHHPLRRIHQEEEEDYTGPQSALGHARSPSQEVKDAPPALPALPSGLAGLAAPVAAAISQSGNAYKNKSQPTSAFARDAMAVFSKLAQSAPKSLSAKLQLVKAQETALTALQFGYKLTHAQKSLLQGLSPRARKELEERVVKTRQAQDRVYLSQLRAKGQVVKRRGGGEQIVSTAKQTVRFPVLLKKVPLEQWPHQYRLYYNLTHYPWVMSEGCQNFSITFAPPGSLPPRGLASFPSSGNTWVRYLIEGATGIFTGSMYDDSSLMRKGMYGEGMVHDSGMTIVQKSHGYTTGEAMTLEDRMRRAQLNHLTELGHRGVVVIRNPFKALISHRHLDVGGHTGYAPKAHFLGEGWAEFVRLKVRLWRDFYDDWVRLTAPSDTYVMHYEDLRDDPVEEMRGVLRHLHIPEDAPRLACLGRNLDGMFKRKPPRNSLLNFDPFTRELRDVIYEAIHAVDGALRERGKAGLPLTKYEIYDPKEVKVRGYLSRGGPGPGLGLGREGVVGSPNS